MSINEWTDKEIVVYSFNGTVISNKKEQATDAATIWIKNTMLSERNPRQVSIFYDSNYKILENAN